MLTEHHNTVRYAEAFCPPASTSRRCTYIIGCFSTRKGTIELSVERAHTARFASTHAAKPTYISERYTHYRKVVFQHTTRQGYTVADPTTYTRRQCVFVPGFVATIQLARVLQPFTHTSSRHIIAENFQSGSCFYTLRAQSNRYVQLHLQASSTVSITVCIANIHITDTADVKQVVTRLTQRSSTYSAEATHSQRNALLRYTGTSDVSITYSVPTKTTVDTATVLLAIAYYSSRTAHIQDVPASTERYAFLDRYYGTERPVVSVYIAADQRKSIAFTYTEYRLDTILCIYGRLEASSRIAFSWSTAIVAERRIFVETRAVHKELTSLTVLHSFTTRPREEIEFRTKLTLPRNAEIYTNANQMKDSHADCVETILYADQATQVLFSGTDTTGAKLGKRSTLKTLLSHTTALLRVALKTEHTVVTSGHVTHYSEILSVTTAYYISRRTIVTDIYTVHHCERVGAANYYVDFRYVNVSGYALHYSEILSVATAYCNVEYSERDAHFRCIQYINTLPIFAAKLLCEPLSFSDKRYAVCRCEIHRNTLPIFAFRKRCAEMKCTDRKVFVKPIILKASLPLFVYVEKVGYIHVVVAEDTRECYYKLPPYTTEREICYDSFRTEHTERAGQTCSTSTQETERYAVSTYVTTTERTGNTAGYTELLSERMCEETGYNIQTTERQIALAVNS